MLRYNWKKAVQEAEGGEGEKKNYKVQTNGHTINPRLAPDLLPLPFALELAAAARDGDARRALLSPMGSCFTAISPLIDESDAGCGEGDMEALVVRESWALRACSRCWACASWARSCSTSARGSEGDERAAG